jgi:hypothetical protein
MLGGRNQGAKRVKAAILTSLDYHSSQSEGKKEIEIVSLSLLSHAWRINGCPECYQEVHPHVPMPILIRIHLPP